MLDTSTAREKSEVSYFNVNKQDLNDCLTGKNKSKKAHEALITLSEYYKLR